MRKVCLLVVIVILLASASIASNPSTVNEKPAFIPSEDYVAHDPIMITSDSDFETQGWPGNGTSEGPFLIENLIIDLEGDNDSAIHIASTDAYWKISNCMLIGNWDIIGMPHTTGKGVWLEFCDNGIIENCTFDSFSRHISMYESDNITISNSNFFGTYEESYGIVGIGITSDMCEFLVIEESNFVDANTGISLSRNNNAYVSRNSIFNCSRGIRHASNHDPNIDSLAVNSTFIENTITNCSGSGITLLNAAFNTIEKNNISGGLGNGIRIDDWSHNNTLSLNILSSNVLSGIYIVEGSTDNVVVNNTLVSNEDNALNDVAGNLYDYNFYSDYTGVDDDGDLIGDTPYYIKGSAPTLDIHPRVYHIPSTTTSTSIITTTNTTETTTLPSDGSPMMTLILIGAGGSVVIIVIIIVIVKTKSRGM